VHVFSFFVFNYYIWPTVFRDSLDGIATRYGLGGPGVECRSGEIFRTCPNRLWGPQSLLINGHRVYIPRVKRLRRGVDHPPTASAEIKKKVQLYLLSSCSPTGLGVCAIFLSFRYIVLRILNNANMHQPCRVSLSSSPSSLLSPDYFPW